MLTEQNIEAELSYAYLHAVASKMGFSCEYGSRHLDGAGVDATITEDGRRLAEDSVLTSFSIDVRLKATYQDLPEQDGWLSYGLTVPHYDKLRLEEVASPRLLVLLRLPANPEEWLQISEDAMIARRCAYWASLRGAPASGNRQSQTVYIRRQNLMSPQGLYTVMGRFSRLEVIRYVAR
jgi:hypothetical protein